MSEELMNVSQNTSVASYQNKRGLEEHTDREDIIFPRVKLMQALSPEVDEGKAKAGDIINHLTCEPLPEKFVCIMKFTTFTKFNPRDRKDPHFDNNFEPAAVIWSTTNPEDPRVVETKFGEDGSKPTAVKFINFMVVPEGECIPMIVSFCKTSIKAGKKLLSMVMFNKGDIWDRKYTLKAVKMTGDAGPYYVFDVSPAGESNAEEREFAAAVYDQMSKQKQEVVKQAQAFEAQPDFSE